MPNDFVVNLPDNYTRGVRITSFTGLQSYIGKNFVMNGKFMRWQEFSSYSINQLTWAFRNGTLYYAREVDSTATKIQAAQRQKALSTGQR